MPEVEKRPGMFTWADLSTPDVTGAQDFYAGVLGWEYEEVPAGEGASYILCRREGRKVAGISAQPAEEVEAGIPPAWTPHLLVEDVGATARRARELGGEVHMEPMDVTEAGRLSVIQDPTGAMVCLWEARGHDGAELFNEEGAMTWNELATRDREAALDFYGELLGWEYEDLDSPAGLYKIIRNRGRPNGGMLQMNEEWPDHIPAHWMCYFSARDVEGATETVRDLGGSVSVEPFDMGSGLMSVVQDPAGAVFTLFDQRSEPPE